MPRLHPPHIAAAAAVTAARTSAEAAAFAGDRPSQSAKGSVARRSSNPSPSRTRRCLRSPATDPSSRTPGETAATRVPAAAAAAAPPAGATSRRAPAAAESPRSSTTPSARSPRSSPPSPRGAPGQRRGAAPTTMTTTTTRRRKRVDPRRWIGWCSSSRPTARGSGRWFLTSSSSLGAPPWQAVASPLRCRCPLPCPWKSSLCTSSPPPVPKSGVAAFSRGGGAFEPCG
jgi:hypothetical protein